MGDEEISRRLAELTEEIQRVQARLHSLKSEWEALARLAARAVSAEDAISIDVPRCD